MNTSVRAFLALLIAATSMFGLSLTSTPAYAQDTIPSVVTDADKAPITVQVRTIYATKDQKGASSDLEDLSSKLLKAFKGYGTFKELAFHKSSVAIGDTFEISVPGGTHLKFTHKGAASEGAAKEKLVRLGMGIDGKFKTDVRASRGTTFFQAGLPHGSGILIFAITVQ